MPVIKKTNHSFLNDTDSDFGESGDGPSGLNTASSIQLPAQLPWGITAGWSRSGTSIGGTHHGTSGSNGTSGSAGTTGGSGSTTSSGSSTASSTGLVINIIWDASVQSAPIGFTAGVMSAVQYLESQFNDPVTINIQVGYGECDGGTLGKGVLGESTWGLKGYSYSQIASALRADATTTADASAIASLPGSISANVVYTTPAEAKALGLAAANGSGTDGYVGFSSAYKYTYDDSNGVAAGTFDLKGIVLHEITEVMGRDLFTSSIAPSVFQLFHYSSPGVIDYGSFSGYFSTDAGKTNLATFNANPAGDAGDWASSVTHDAADAVTSAGVVNNFSRADVTAMDAIGWNANPYQPSPPTGVTFTAVTGTLSKAMSATGLNPNVLLANISEVGGATADSYSYALGGPDAAAFALSTMNNVGKLTAAGTGVAGAVNGALYQLTVSATDASGAGSTASPAGPLDIIVGSSGSDNIQIASLVGLSGTATPTFIYSLGGNDTMSGSGMAGKLWLASGAGADVMTGGSGANRYLYCATADSTASSMDLITNFHAGSDLIDLSGISAALKSAGSLSGTTIAAQSVGWQASGSDTFVYVNTSAASTSLGAASMAIDLHGTVALAAKNFVL